MGAAFAVVGGLISAAGSVMQGQAQAKAYEAQAKVAQQNARLAELQGAEELKKGAREEAKFRQQARQFQSSQRTAMAASGGQMSGSTLNVLADTAQGIEEDATTLRFNTLQNKWGHDVQRTNFINEASAARASAKNAKTAGWMGGFTTLLSTGSQVLGMMPNQPTGSRSVGGNIVVGSSYGDWTARQRRQRGGF